MENLNLKEMSSEELNALIRLASERKREIKAVEEAEEKAVSLAVKKLCQKFFDELRAFGLTDVICQVENRVVSVRPPRKKGEGHGGE